MNHGIPLSWGCTGNTLSNQWSIDDEQTTFQRKQLSFKRIKPCRINQEREKNSVNKEYPWYFNFFLSECMRERYQCFLKHYSKGVLATWKIWLFHFKWWKSDSWNITRVISITKHQPSIRNWGGNGSIRIQRKIHNQILQNQGEWTKCIFPKLYWLLLLSVWV